MNRHILFDKIRKQFLTLMNGYILHELITESNVDKYIVKSRFGNDAGLYSALALA